MLRFGSVGEEVRRLQSALNLDPGGETLATDGHFGIKTHGRVTGFQRVHGTVPDGIVGPLTMSLLGFLLELLDHQGKRTPPDREQQLRQHIADRARFYRDSFGYNDPKKLSKEPQRILQRFMLDSTLRTRQGGASLQSILNGGGAPAGMVQKCLVIPPGMARGELFESSEEARTHPARDEQRYSKLRSSRDIFHWCGVFATMVLRDAGIPVKGWEVSGGLTSQLASKSDPPGHVPPLRMISPAELDVGDVGVLDPSYRNHHFIVVERQGHVIKTIDGNAGFYHSVVDKTYVLQKPNSTDAKNFTKVSWEDCVLMSAFPMASQGGPGAANLPPLIKVTL